MLEKIMVLHEMKLMGIDISAQLEKMYEKYGKEGFQRAAKVSGYGFILQQFLFRFSGSAGAGSRPGSGF